MESACSTMLAGIVSLKRLILHCKDTCDISCEQHNPLELWQNAKDCLLCSSDRVKPKPARSTALNVKWKHRLGCITVYILWIGITCLMNPARSEVCCRERERVKGRERLEKTEGGGRLGKWRREDEWEQRKKRGKRWRENGENERGGQRNPGQFLIRWDVSFYPVMQLRWDMRLPSKAARKCNTASLMCRLIPLIQPCVHFLPCALVCWWAVVFGAAQFPFPKTIVVNNYSLLMSGKTQQRLGLTCVLCLWVFLTPNAIMNHPQNKCQHGNPLMLLNSTESTQTMSYFFLV